MVSKKLLAGIFALFCAATAHADPISLSSGFAVNNNHLTFNQSHNFQLNVNNELAAQNLNSKSILSGILTVSGYSDADYAHSKTETGNGKTGTVPRDYTECNNKGKCTTKSVNDNIHVNDITDVYSDKVADQMLVSVGGISGFDFADEVAQDDSHGKLVWDKTTGSANGGYNIFYHRNSVHHDSLSGDLLVMLSLDSIALNDLFADGILDLTVKSLLGQFNVTDIRLDFVAQEVAVPPDAQVPVPTSLLLTGLGLAALATARRRKA